MYSELIAKSVPINNSRLNQLADRIMDSAQMNDWYKDSRPKEPVSLDEIRVIIKEEAEQANVDPGEVADVLYRRLVLVFSQSIEQLKPIFSETGRDILSAAVVLNVGGGERSKVPAPPKSEIIRVTKLPSGPTNPSLIQRAGQSGLGGFGKIGGC